MLRIAIHFDLVQQTALLHQLNFSLYTSYMDIQLKILSMLRGVILSVSLNVPNHYKHKYDLYSPVTCVTTACISTHIILISQLINSYQRLYMQHVHDVHDVQHANSRIQDPVQSVSSTCSMGSTCSTARKDLACLQLLVSVQHISVQSRFSDTYRWHYMW